MVGETFLLYLRGVAQEGLLPCVQYCTWFDDECMIGVVLDAGDVQAKKTQDSPYLATSTSSSRSGSGHNSPTGAPENANDVAAETGGRDVDIYVLEG